VDVKFLGDNSTQVTGLTTGPWNPADNLSAGNSGTAGPSSWSTGGSTTTGGSTNTGGSTTTTGGSTNTSGVQYKCP
jgi:hypothetical protein